MRMTRSIGSAFHRDIARWRGDNKKMSLLEMLRLVVVNPGLQAALLLRTQMELQTTGHVRSARAVSLLNLRLTGAEFLVGCRIGPGIVMRHPQGIVVGSGAIVGEDCTILHRVTLGERFGQRFHAAHAYPRVGAGVVIGAGAAILGGVNVGDDAVVGANAVVLHDVNVADVVVGVPARPVRRT